MGIKHVQILSRAPGNEEAIAPTQQCLGCEGLQEEQVCPTSSPRGLIRSSGGPEEGALALDGQEIG